MDITNNTDLIEALLLEEFPDCREESNAGVSNDEVVNLQLPSPRGFNEVFERAIDSVFTEVPTSSPSNEDVLECPINQVPTSPIPGSSVQTNLPSANTSSHRTERLPEPNRKWKKRNLDTILPEYIADTGVVEDCFAHCTTLTDIFLVLIGDIVDNIVYQSNHHATQKGKALNLQKEELLTFIITCPVAAKDYNSHMGGVDTADRLRALYCIDRKSPKWRHRLFWGLLDVTFVNSYVIHGLIMEQTTVKDFRHSITQGLMTMKYASQKRKTSTDNSAKSGPSKRRKSDYSTIKDVRLGNRGSHWPTLVENRGRCEVCSKKKIQSKPHSKCLQCNVFLCVNEK